MKPSCGIPIKVFFIGLLLQHSLSQVVRVSPVITDSCSQGDDYEKERDTITTGVRKIINTISPCKESEGWTKVMDIDMSNADDKCPKGLTQYTSPFRLCGRTHKGGDYCESSIISVRGHIYSKVCGKIKGYHQGTKYAFYGRKNIENSYMDGVSLTYGHSSSRQHIWSFVTAVNTNSYGSNYCPRPGVDALPTFITNDYFCDSGIHGSSTATNNVYVDNPLWDGVDGGCNKDPAKPPRCYANNPPWFYKRLPVSTTEDIELRICGYGPASYGDTLIEKIELYVK